MDQILVERVMARIADNVSQIRPLVGGETDDDRRNDLCDLEVTRVFSRAIVDAGMPPTDLGATGEVLLLTSDVMNHHGRSLEFSRVADRLSWSYASLYARLLALAFLEAGDPATPSSIDPSSWIRPRVFPLDALAAQVTVEAVDRLAVAVEAARAMAPRIEAASPYADRIEMVLEIWPIPSMAEVEPNDGG